MAEDIPLLFSLLSDVFPNVSYTRAEMSGLKEEIRKVCGEEYLVCGEGDEQGSHWMEKVNYSWSFFDYEVGHPHGGIRPFYNKIDQFNIIYTFTIHLI